MATKKEYVDLKEEIMKIISKRHDGTIKFLHLEQALGDLGLEYTNQEMEGAISDLFTEEKIFRAGGFNIFVTIKGERMLTLEAITTLKG